MKNLTPSVYTFEDLICGNYLYIDKTEYLWQLVAPYKGIYFLSRPRRFGKSLTLSTLKSIFQGKRELFKGLAIDSKPYEWQKYPIIHLNFANCTAKDAQSLCDYLYFSLLSIANEAQVHPLMDKNQLGLSFSNLITSMDTGHGVVILIDEYDKPLLNNLADSDVVQELLPVIKGFFSAIKASEPHQRFVFVTGVTKFCHVSLFSDLNNLQDISTDEHFSTMLGYTQSELEQNFIEYFPAAQAKQELSYQELLQELKLWYDGYRFTTHAESVYNPVSIASFFGQEGNFGNYWYSTGTTSSLFQLMRRQDFELPEILEQAVSSSIFDSFDIATVDLQKLMYQSGYLTIGESTPVQTPGLRGKQWLYHLRFPNYEVRSSFNEQIMEHYAGMRNADTGVLTRQLVSDIQQGDIDGFMNRLKILFARIPYNLHGRRERDYQTILYVIALMLNVSIAGEYHTNEGRIDLVLSSNNCTYVIELKIGKTAHKALAQIWDKDYPRAFLAQGRRVIAVGVNFNKKKAQIDNWVSEEVFANSPQ